MKSVIVEIYKQNKPFIFLVVLFLVTSMVYSYFTVFEKIITVKEKDSMRTGKYGKNIISDTDGNVYTIENSIFYDFFTAMELFTKIEQNQSYKVKGFGYRIPILGIYPNIIKASKT
jgi:hypothetical protein